MEKWFRLPTIAQSFIFLRVSPFIRILEVSSLSRGLVFRQRFRLLTGISSRLRSSSEVSSLRQGFRFSSEVSSLRWGLRLSPFRNIVSPNNYKPEQQEHLSMAARLKLLTRQYGASAISVYFIISTIDLGLTFVLIQSGGAERVKMIEEWFTETFGGWIVLKKKNLPHKEDSTSKVPVIVKKDSREGSIDDQHKYDASRHHFPSWAGTFVIAYGIHKVLFPLRLGLTAAITPPLVRKLRRMGWNIGKPNKF